jgi:hypothetical protein
LVPGTSIDPDCCKTVVAKPHETSKSRGRRWGRLLKAAVAVAAAALFLDYWLYPHFASPGGIVLNSGNNGIWLRNSWYAGDYTSGDLNVLNARLLDHGIGDAYFHVRSIAPDGSLMYRKPESAQALNRQLAKLNPGLRRFAWVYVGNASAGGKVHLSNPATRRHLVEDAEWLVKDCGFQGIQWDYENCADGDAGFLNLLDETRKFLPPQATISVAAPGWYPAPLSAIGWSPTYLGEIAKRSGQIVVMAYDSGIYFPRAYTWWVSQQVEVATESVEHANAKCSVLIGLPTYGKGTISHNPRAENLRLGLLGVRHGLAKAKRGAWQGVAIFADYTTTASDWLTFDSLWPAAK